MTQTSWPFDNADTNEEQFSEIFKRLTLTGVVGDPSTNDLKPYGDSTGMQVKIPAGYAFVRGFLYKNTAPDAVVPIQAASAFQRLDYVVLRLDPSVNSVVAAAVAGTSANALPALTQTDAGIFEMPIGIVTVGTGVSTIAADKVADARLFNSKPFGKWTTSNRPTNPTRGDAGFNFTIGAPEYYDGTQWQPFMATSITAAMISDQQNINAGKLSGRKFTVNNTGTAPASPAFGDVWIDFS